MHPSGPTTSPAAFLGRLMWIMIGPLALMITTYLIVDRGGGWLTPPDYVFFGILAAMLLGRWLEFRGGNPQTADGEPATPSHLHRYVLFALLIGLGIWVVANVLGNHWLNQ